VGEEGKLLELDKGRKKPPIGEGKERERRSRELTIQAKVNPKKKLYAFKK